MIGVSLKVIVRNFRVKLRPKPRRQAWQVGWLGKATAQAGERTGLGAAQSWKGWWPGPDMACSFGGSPGLAQQPVLTETGLAHAGPDWPAKIILSK